VSAGTAAAFLAGAVGPALDKVELLDGAAKTGGFTAFERTLSKDEFPAAPPPGTVPGATGESGVEFADRLFGSGGRN
jgi:hypothetical protein